MFLVIMTNSSSVSHSHVVEGSQVHDDIGVHLHHLHGGNGRVCISRSVELPARTSALYSDVVQMTILLNHLHASFA